MAIVFQQVTSMGFIAMAAPSISFTPLSNASIIVVGINIQNNPGYTLTSVSDTTNGTYTQIGRATTSGGYSDTYAYWVSNSTTSAVTIALSITGGVSGCINVWEFTGQAASSIIGTTSTGTLTSGTAADVNTAGNVSGSAGDCIVSITGNYYGVTTWVVGATNPSGVAIPAGASVNQGSVDGNLTGSYTILGSSYANKVGNNPGTGVSDYGSTVGFQIKSGGVVTFTFSQLVDYPNMIPVKNEIVCY